MSVESNVLFLILKKKNVWSVVKTSGLLLGTKLKRYIQRDGYLLNSAKSNKARTSRFKPGDSDSTVYNAGRLGFELCLGTVGSVKNQIHY